MTVTSSTNRNAYTGNGSTTVFARTFLAKEESHIKVYQTISGVTTEVTSGITHSGVGTASGNVTFTTAPATGTSITIIREVPFTQETDYQSQGKVSPQQVEDDLDLQAQQAQDLNERLGRTYAAPITGKDGVEGNLLKVNADGDLVDAEVSYTDIQAAQAAAEAAQAAAETAQSEAETALDTFDDRMLGSKASDPTTDNDGNALLEGAQYWNTTTKRWRTYNGTAFEDDVNDTNVGTVVDGVSGKSTPVDADTIPLTDSAASQALKKVTWANIKSTLATYFASLTQTLTNKTIDAASNTISNLQTSMFATNVIDTDTTLNANSDTRIASQKATKAYVDTIKSGLLWKDPVDVATTANITLSGEQTIDGVLTSTSRVLVKDQTDQTENGLYLTGAGAWTRTTGGDSADELQGASVLVQQGSTYADTQWQQTADGITLGSSNIVWTQFGGAGTFTAGTGLELSGNAFQLQNDSLKSINGLTPAADRLPYYTGAAAAALATFTSYGRTLLGLADAAALRSNLSVEENADVTDAENVASSINGATAKTTPVDADKIGIIDSAASNVLKTLTFANLKTYLNGLYVQLTTLTTKGDIFVRTASGVARLAVGSNNQVLTADSSETSGVKWADAQGSGGNARNLVVDGGMVSCQGDTSTTGVTGIGYYGPDMFQTLISSLGTWTVSQDTDAPTGFSNSLKLACTTADASPSAGDYVFVKHKIEGRDLQHLKKGTADAVSLTLGIWVKCKKTGTFQVNLLDVDNTRHIGSTITIAAADTWEFHNFTVAGDTTGLLDNDENESLTLEFWFDAGSNYTGGATPTSWEAQANADRAAGVNLALGDSTANYINITGIQLEVGDTASDFVHEPFGDVLRKVQRHFYSAVDATDGNTGVINVAAYSSNNNYGYIRFPVEMRDAPTMTYSAGSDFAGRMSNSATCSSLNTQGTYTRFGVTLYFQSTSTAGNAGWVETLTSSAYIRFDARM